MVVPIQEAFSFSRWWTRLRKRMIRSTPSPAEMNSRGFRLPFGQCDLATGPLCESNDSPWKIIIDNDGAILQILSFTKNIRCNQDAKLVLGLDRVQSLVAPGTESPLKDGRIIRVPFKSFEHGKTLEFSTGQSGSGRALGQLGKNQDLLRLMGSVISNFRSAESFSVFFSTPFAAVLENIDQ